jgi:hypothetical protein
MYELVFLFFINNKKKGYKYNSIQILVKKSKVHLVFSIKKNLPEINYKMFSSSLSPHLFILNRLSILICHHNRLSYLIANLGIMFYYWPGKYFTYTYFPF